MSPVKNENGNLCIELLPVLVGRRIYFRYNATSGETVDNTIKQLNSSNNYDLFIMFCFGYTSSKLATVSF